MARRQKLCATLRSSRSHEGLKPPCAGPSSRRTTPLGLTTRCRCEGAMKNSRLHQPLAVDRLVHPVAGLLGQPAGEIVRRSPG